MGHSTLGDLCAHVRDVRLPAGAAALAVRAVTDDSRAVRPGDVFVAVPGTASDGTAHVREAVGRGAAAVVAEQDAGAGVPVVRVRDARIALAELAAAAYGHPSCELQLVGITGTVGKTSVLAMLAAILDEAGIPAGTIGSLGIRFASTSDTSPNTTPGALHIERALRGMADAGVRVAAMEVTSHALAQQRVHGLVFDLGIFTNLTMLEHLEYHGSFREYAGAKLRFIDQLAAGAPLLYSTGDRIVRQAARRHAGPRISCGGGSARVRVRRESVSLDGTRVALSVHRPLPRLDGSCLDPVSFPLALRTLGRPNIANATLAAAAGLCLGAEPQHVARALGGIEQPRRRMEVIRRDDPIIIDDTVGHPDSISGVLELVGRVPHRRLRIVFAVRGRRGPHINLRDAETLAIWSRLVRIDALHVTSATDTADARNRTSEEERTALVGALRRSGVSHEHHDRLEDAIAAALDGVGERDLVLLLGAQAMDAGADIARRLLTAERRG